MRNYEKFKNSSLKIFNKMENNYTKKNKVKCKCGHSITFLSSHSKICSFCGNIVYPDEKCKFKEMLEKEIRNVK